MPDSVQRVGRQQIDKLSVLLSGASPKNRELLLFSVTFKVQTPWPLNLLENFDLN